LRFPVVYKKNRRRAGIRQFPYGIFFVVEDDRVVVIACFHGKHGPTIQAAEIAEELRSIGVTCKLKAETWRKVAS